MRNTNRLIALALCCTLTLGAFVYRPPEAKAVAGVDDAIVIGALLSAFAGGCGLIFSNNGMSSNEIAQGLTAKWNEFNESAENAASSFAAWLGFEDTSALLGALSFSGGKLAIPRAIARKFAEFTTWLTSNTGVSAGGDSRPILTGNSDYAPTFALVAIDAEVAQKRVNGVSDAKIDKYISSFDGVKYIGVHFPTPVVVFCNVQGSVQASYIVAYSSDDPQFIVYDGTVEVSSLGRPFGVFLSGSKALFCFAADGAYLGARSWGGGSAVQLSDYIDGVTFSGDSPVTDLSIFAPSYYQNPTIDLPVEGEEAANPTLSGVGDGSATSIEDLLQQILAQLQANTLAPTLDLAGTETGGETGTDTDEDAKPYLPFIPQIFEKVKEIPGTLSNIWDTVKQLPAAIAEKISAFFTTLWGWLQDIIAEIKALPAAIAEKVGALFTPDEALVTEITDTFKGKFGFLSNLNAFVNDLFSLTPETEPPVIWVHLENAESKYGYVYGDKQKILDLAWYQKYKGSVDGILSGFLWLGYLWLLFKRAPGILNGMALADDDAPRSADIPDTLNAPPRLNAGDGSTMFHGDGFTMRDKGGRGR